MWICISSKCRWTKGSRSLRHSFLSGLPLPFTLLHPPLNITTLPISIHHALLLSPLHLHSLGLPSLLESRYLRHSNFFLYRSPSVCFFFCSALTLSALTVHTPFHFGPYPDSLFHFSIPSCSIFRQSLTTSFTLILTRHGKWAANVIIWGSNKVR